MATTRLIDRVRESFADKTADEDLLAFVKSELKGLLEDPRPGRWRSPRRGRAST